MRSVSLADSKEANIVWMQQTLGNQAAQRKALTCAAFSSCPTGGAYSACREYSKIVKLISESEFGTYYASPK